jgi:hypothetical protein
MLIAETSKCVNLCATRLQVCGAQGVTFGLIQDEAVIFHEALHGYTGLKDTNILIGIVTLESILGLQPSQDSTEITKKIRTDLLGGPTTNPCPNTGQ